jgi:hypothetical protein
VPSSCTERQRCQHVTQKADLTAQLGNAEELISAAESSFETPF